MRTAHRRLLPSLTIAVLAMSGCSRGGLPAVVVSPLPSASPSVEKGCVRFSAALPGALKISKTQVLKRRHTDPPDLRLAAYGDPAVVVRCGVAPSPDFSPGAPVLRIDEVEWFHEEKPTAVVFSLPTKFVNIEITVPRAYPAELLALFADAAKSAQPL